MRVAAAQISCSLGDLEANITKIEQFTERGRSAGAELVVFPEMSDTGYAMETIRAQAQAWTSGAVPRLQKCAARLSIAIICGVSQREKDRIYNSQVVIGHDGQILAQYRKTHLFKPAPIAEHTCFAPGDRLVDLPLGDFRAGLTICYDLRFPEIYRALALEHRVDLFVLSSAWPFPRVEHFRTLALARAIENQSYFISANRVGTDNGVTFCGSSAIIDPSGATLAVAASEGEELLVADISMDPVRQVRSRMPVFEHRRADVYR